MMKVALNQKILSQIQEIVEQYYPHESCGFFSGTDRAERKIEELWMVENKSTENLRRRFVIDPIDYMRAEKQTAQSGQVLQGIFHSHPDHPAVPSVHDLKNAMPFFSYIIASVRDGKMTRLRSWKLNAENKFEEEEIIIS